MIAPIVLASASPRRRALLEALGIAIEVVPSGAEEITEGHPETVAVQNAERKRDEVAARRVSPALIVAADTIVVLGDRILNKPATLDEARGMIRDLSGRTHRVITGVAVANTSSGSRVSGIESTEVTFRPLSEGQIAQFVDTVRPLDRAGAYTVDGPGTLIVQSYNGCYQNVLGLPVPRLEALLETLGESLFDRMDARAAKFL